MSCGRCRIRLSRGRTWILIGYPPSPPILVATHMLEQHFTRYLEGLKRERQIPLSLELWNGSQGGPGRDAPRTPQGKVRVGGAAADEAEPRQPGRGLYRGRHRRRRSHRGSGRRCGPAGRTQRRERQAQRRCPTGSGRHTRSSDRKAIQYHYDVSNEFYSQWLDPRMVYSCAYFRTGTEDLATAQTAKLDLICRKLKLLPEERLLDIGCGWGAMVIHAASRYGVRAVGVTLSEQPVRAGRAARARRGPAGPGGNPPAGLSRHPGRPVRQDQLDRHVRARRASRTCRSTSASSMTCCAKAASR